MGSNQKTVSYEGAKILIKTAFSLGKSETIKQIENELPKEMTFREAVMLSGTDVANDSAFQEGANYQLTKVKEILGRIK